MKMINTKCVAIQAVCSYTIKIYVFNTESRTSGRGLKVTQVCATFHFKDV